VRALNKKLFCFPYAGGSASFYREWGFANNEIDVIPLEYPGHGSKYCEPLCNNMSDLTDILIKEMQEKYQLHTLKTISLFGHSMGATVAYEIAEKLERKYDKKIDYLFLSSKSSPNNRMEQIDCSNVNKLKGSLIQMGGTNEKILEEEDFLDVFLPIIQEDLNILTNYHGISKHQEKLNCQAVLLLGSDDTVTMESILSWNQYIESIKALHVLKGDHFYLKQNQVKVLKMIEKYLLNIECENFVQI
jgi:medium-chain acyl-[acyl-carrier-protein] hydrolase